MIYDQCRLRPVPHADDVPHSLQVNQCLTLMVRSVMSIVERNKGNREIKDKKKNALKGTELSIDSSQAIFFFQLCGQGAVVSAPKTTGKTRKDSILESCKSAST